MKSFTNKPHDPPRPFQPASNVPSMKNAARQVNPLRPKTMHSSAIGSDVVKSTRVTNSGSYWIEFRENSVMFSRATLDHVMSKAIPISTRQNGLSASWEETSATTDERNIEHVRIRQLLNGIPIARQEIILHVRNGMLRDLNGYAWTGPLPESSSASIDMQTAAAAARDYLAEQNVRFTTRQSMNHQSSIINSLCWFPKGGALRLACEIDIHPNPLDFWKLFIDANTSEVLLAYPQHCSIYPSQLYTHEEYSSTSGIESKTCESTPEESHVPTLPRPPKADLPARPKSSEGGRALIGSRHATLADGPTMVMDADLFGQNRLVHGYLVGADYFMIDASRDGMFKPMQSVLPNEPVGVIWTIDGQNGSPQQDNFEVIHVTNTNNNWDPLEVSAHYNAGYSYEYFLQTFDRNSLNGNGGNIISIINVADENGDDMDNAFWSGTAMFYGNGNVAFQPLAKALDVAGHEMSHGVIQNTAGLEYMEQSGALNESFADVFGAMIDRDDWKMGEDVVNLNVFPSGALRDLSDPHNGGNDLNDNGWQPKHMNEYQNLPNTPDGDNGGVHVNSGIPNHAFFLFASNVGKEKAEQIYYKALRDYLVKSSQFVDMRNAVEKAAADLHGTNSAEVTAARNAFNAVGIGAGTGDDYQDDLETNPGDDFIIATDAQESDLYWVPPSNPGQFVKMNVPAPQSRPSFTDNGNACVYVDWDNEMILINFDWSQGLDYQAFYLESNPQGIWRNLVVSKDGSKIAYTTSQLTNEISVFDFNNNINSVFTLFNPTTAAGIVTGDVLYPDAMEWDYSGEYVMYDALNRIESAFGNGIEYWDISFVHVWDNGFDDFAEGYIGKMFNYLPENVSVGNPSFAKNSPYIIVFDFLEEYYDLFGFLQTDYRILAANIESGTLSQIYENTTVGYPSYSRQDDRVLFTYDDFGNILLATIDVQPGDKTLPIAGTDVILIEGAQKGVWFQTGSRIISSTEEVSGIEIGIYPQPAGDMLYLIYPEGEEHVTSYRLLDITGRFIDKGIITGNRIDLTRITSGSYMLELLGDNVLVRKKLLRG